jgi:hypothetical protein
MIVAPRRARRSRKKQTAVEIDRGIRGAPLSPIRTVERELVRPDGSKLRVAVPVYPPFRLEDRPAPKARAALAEKKAS